MNTRFLAVLSTVGLFALPWAGDLAAQGSGTDLEPEPREPVTRVGTRGANFLEIGVGARPMAMGGAVGALADGVDALYWNSAGIATAERSGASFTHAALYEDFDIDHLFGGVVVPFGQGAFGLSLTHLTSGEILRTTEAFPEGGTPEIGRTFEWTASAAALHYGRRITDRLNFGAAVKVASEGISQARATYAGADFGLQFRTGLYGTSIGASLSNVGLSGRMDGSLLERQSPGGGQNPFPSQGIVEWTFDTESWQMPTLFRFSIATDLVGGPDALVAPNPDHNVVVVADLADAVDTDIQTHLGVEYSFNRLFFLRGGKRWANEGRTGAFRDLSHGLSGGAGLRLPLGDQNVTVDYAYVGMGELSNVQLFSVGIGF